MFAVNKPLIQIITECATACELCHTACLKERDVSVLVVCILLDMECVTMCKATARLLQLGSDHANAACQLCADICIACAEECEKHEHEHCRQCAIACRECAEQCMGVAA